VSIDSIARCRCKAARPREVRLLLAGPYYYDVDMVNSLPNVARQLAGGTGDGERESRTCGRCARSAASATRCWGAS
jgi:hypothetical protein